jgi:pimeloyl-ACP methyl ester carboxylesterase
VPAASDPSQLSIVHETQPDGPGLTACWLQSEPARQLPRLQGLKILNLLSESSYHAPYDHCTVKWLRQAGVTLDFMKLTDLGIFGNGHLMLVEKNSDRLAGLVEQWLNRNVSGKGVKLEQLASSKGSVGPLQVEKQGVFFVGGQYNDAANPTFMSGQMYVHYQIPEHARKKAYPVVLIHGGGQQEMTFTGTPDDRSGWADYLLDRGYSVYTVDQPGRGRSPYVDGVYGAYGTLNIKNLEDQFTATELAKLWPQAVLHTQWPGGGLPGSYAFDQFIAQQYQGMGALIQEQTTSKALIALLHQIGPAILITHSQSGPHGWDAADARPDLVKGIIAVEPNGPPFYEVSFTGAPNWFSYGALGRAYGITRLPLTFSPAVTDPAQLAPVQQSQADGPNMVRCFLQSEPAHKLTRLASIPIVVMTGEASFRSTYDHCTSKFLTQAGVKNTHVRLENFGIHGNGHMMMLEKNNLEIAKLISKLIENGMQARGER